jgi:hypothetical protein
MGEPDRQAQEALERIAGVEKRLAALQELGLDTAALRSQLAFAQTRLLEGAVADADRICDEVLSTARRMAQGSGEIRVRTAHLTREELAQEIRLMLSQGMLAQLLAEQQAGPDPRLEARLSAYEQKVREFIQGSYRKLEEATVLLRTEMNRSIEMLRGEIALIRQPSTETPNRLEGLDKAIETLAVQQRESQAALITAVEELGESIANHGDSGHAAVATAVEHVAAVCAQRPGDQGESPLVSELHRLADAVANRLDKGETVAAAVRDGLAAVGQAMSAPHGDIHEIELRSTLQNGFDRIAQALERQAAPHVTGSDMGPMAAEWQALDDSLTPPVATSPAGAGGVAEAVREGFRDLIQALAATHMPTAPTTEPGSATTTEPRVELLQQELGRIAKALEDRPTVVPTDLGPLIEVVTQRLGGEALQQQVVSSLETGLAKIAEALTALHVPQKPASPEKPQPQDAGGIEAMFDGVESSPASLPGEDSRLATEFISEHDTTRTSHQVPTANMVAEHVGKGDESVTKVSGAHLRRMVEEEVGRVVGTAPLRDQVLKMMPDLIKEPAISQSLFALIALEAVAHPGVLGELTGLRSFLRRELKIAVEALAKDLQPV